MTAKELKFSFEARDRLLHGIDMLASAVRVTLGPRGRNVAIDRSFGAKITKDGVTVAKEIELDNKFENMGVQMVRQVANRTSYQDRRRHDHRGRARSRDRQGAAPRRWPPA